MKNISVAVIFIVLGLFFVGIAFYMYTDQTAFLAVSKTASGTVISNVSHSDDDGYTYSPVVSFTTKEGELKQFESNNASEPPAYHVGEKIEVLYDPANPDHAQINNFFESWLGCIILGFIGAMFSIVGFIAIFFRGTAANQNIPGPQTNGFLFKNNQSSSSVMGTTENQNQNQPPPTTNFR